MLRQVQAYVAARQSEITPPLVLDELRARSEEIVRGHGIDPKYIDYVGVLLANETWREHLAAVPYDRRLLLLPKCLRVEDRCPAPFDEFGLLCKQCGLCTIQDLQEEAEKLGYAVLVAEGSALVMALIQTGKIEAIVGVSCLSVLERGLPLHGGGRDSGRGDSAAAGRLQGHGRRRRMGLGLHPCHERRPDPPARSRRVAARRRELVRARGARRAVRRTANRRDRDAGARGADTGRQALEALSDRLCAPGAAGRSARGAAGRATQGRGGGGVLPQGLAGSR